MTAQRASRAARAIIAKNSKSFALASKLLPPSVRHDAVILYAYCRRVDDAIDEVPPSEQLRALAELRGELDDLYEGVPQPDPLLAALQTVIQDRAIPRFCFDDLLAGMQMDVEGVRYATRAQLILYCYRVAGTVGLMMCHVMGARGEAALAHGKDLGIAMQLTNIARDVLEDWRRDRLYLPDELLQETGAGSLRDSLGTPFPPRSAPAVSRAIEALLDWADDYYASGDRGLRYLSFRCAAAVYAARLVYSSIGTVLRRRKCDPLSGRAIVPKTKKLALAVRALIAMAFAATLQACAHNSESRGSELKPVPPIVQPAPEPEPVAPAPMPAAATTQPAAPPAEDPSAAQPAAVPSMQAPTTPVSGEVVVDVRGLENDEGRILVALYRDGKGFPDGGAKAFDKRVAKARAGSVRFVFSDVPPGPFAVTVHHDEDKDYEMDTNLFGAPSEGYGFSRDASAPFGPPDFADAKLTLAPSERKRVPINMKY